MHAMKDIANVARRGRECGELLSHALDLLFTSPKRRPTKSLESEMPRVSGFQDTPREPFER